MEVLNGTVELTTASPLKVGLLLFSWFDYSLFGLMLGVSILIGIWFGFCGKKEDSTTEYLLGGKTMKVFPIAMSLIASHISGITLLGVPADVYLYGTSYWMGSTTVILVGIVVSYVYLPVFYKLQLTSSYEYLKLRFSPTIRVFASFLFALAMVLYIPIVIYLPALAFSQATGINLHIITPIVCLTCIFYTTIGGLKAVVWTDTIQFSCTVGSLITVFILGLQKTGGLVNVWTKSDEGGRIDFFKMDIDPTLRNSFWSVTIGFFFAWVSHTGVNQGCVQRFLAVPTIQDARKSVIIFCLGIILIKSVSSLIGLIIYVRYAQCDPLMTGHVKRSDQLLPYYVMDVAGHIYGLPGLFIAGVFSAALSTMSAGLNTLAGTIYEDFIAPFLSSKTSGKRASNILKLIVIVVGLISLGLVFVVEQLGSILALAISLGGVTAGPLLGLFTLGLLFPSANPKGALIGGIGSVLLVSWIVVGAQYHIAKGTLFYDPKPLSIDACPNATITKPMNHTVVPEEDLPFFPYRISNYYYSVIGTLAVIIIGLPVSWVTGGWNQVVSRDVLSPVVYWLLPKDERTPPPEYNTVEVALKVVRNDIEVYPEHP